MMEVIQPLPLPFGLDSLQVSADGPLVDADLAGDFSLGPLLQVEPGHHGAALLDM